MIAGEGLRPLLFFRRTSTIDVWDCILGGRDSFESVRQEMQSRGHRRKDHDIRNMVSHLARVGLVQDYQPTDFGRIVEVLARRDLPVPNRVALTRQVLDGFMERGFLLRPFLSAFFDRPSSNKTLAAYFFRKARDEGYYNLNAETDYNDFVPAMKNVLRYLGLVESRGFALTSLGEAVLQPNLLEESPARSTCGPEWCRRVCPASAIHANFVQGCVNCLLCVRCCPFGAAQVANGQINIDFMRCAAVGQQFGLGRNSASIALVSDPYFVKLDGAVVRAIPEILSPSLLSGEEGILQNWLGSTLRILDLQATVLGPGEQPDLAVNLGVTRHPQNDSSQIIPSGSAIFECKKDPVTGKKVGKVVQQLERYMQANIIQKVTEYLDEVLGFKLSDPQNFILFAPGSSTVDDILALTEILPYPVSFVSYEAMLAIYKGLVLRTLKPDPQILWDIFGTPREDLSPNILQLVSY
jgi:hypothetical protein